MEFIDRKIQNDRIIDRRKQGRITISTIQTEVYTWGMVSNVFCLIAGMYIASTEELTIIDSLLISACVSLPTIVYLRVKNRISKTVTGESCDKKQDKL